jgi:hypothetical protein
MITCIAKASEKFDDLHCAERPRARLFHVYNVIPKSGPDFRKRMMRETNG